MAAPQPKPRARDSTQALGRLAVALLPLLVVAALRLAPPFDFADSGDLPGWVAVAATAAGTAMVALAAVLLLGAALTTAGVATAIGAMASGAIATGLGLDALGAAASGSPLPGPGMAIAAVVAAGLLVVRVPLPDGPIRHRGRRAGFLLAAFVVLEAVLVAGLFLADAARDAIPWLLGAGAIGVASAAFASWAAPGLERRAFPGSLLLAASLGAFALARPDSADQLAGLGGLVAAAVAIGRNAAEIMAAATDGAGSEDGSEFPQLAAVPVALLPGMPAIPAEDDRARADAERLARELRGTIEELLQARQIIDLQRNEISRAAVLDALTGTIGRRAILERLAMEVREARRYSHPVAVALLDVDGFRALNAEHGLAVGDAILRELGLRMRLRMRAADALGRLGNDGFLAILPHTDERGAAGLANALLRRITARPFATEIGEVSVGVSIGVALMRPGMELTDEQLLVAAEEAWTSARAAGGNRIAFDRLHGLARLDDRRHEG